MIYYWLRIIRQREFQVANLLKGYFFRNWKIYCNLKAKTAIKLNANLYSIIRYVECEGRERHPGNSKRGITVPAGHSAII